MIHFIKRVMLFGAPFGLCAAFVYMVDPYNYLGRQSVISNEVKLRTAYPLNYCLWKIPAFARNPSPYLLLGDSRMNAVRTERLREVTGDSYFNLAYGGATIREIVSSFWFASQHVPLRRVYIGLNFNLYTDYEDRDRTAEVLRIESAPACYFINQTVLTASLDGVLAQWLHIDPKIGAVRVDRDTFWRVQIGPTTAGFYTRHAYPRKYHAELEKIVQHVRVHGGEVAFIIFPTHTDLQNRVKDFGLDQEYDRFKHDLSALATTYDFDYPNELTSNRDNFSDPYHCKHECVDDVIREVWSGYVKYGKRLSERPEHLSSIALRR
jgi:hypothetical protein